MPHVLNDILNDIFSEPEKTITAEELQQKFPLTWEEAVKAYDGAIYDEKKSDAWEFRKYFDSVNIFVLIEIDFQENHPLMFYYTAVEVYKCNGATHCEEFGCGCYKTRDEAENACILEAFEIREQILHKKKAENDNNGK